LILDSWQRSGLPAGDFAPLVGMSKHTLYAWKARFEEEGPAGLADRKRGGPKGSRLSELTKRAVIMMKESNPDWGAEKISDMLLRDPALSASPGAVSRVLQEWGLQVEDRRRPARHDPPVRRFQREQPNELWQTDLFTFILKRQNQRVYLVAFMDDHSRFIVGYALHASQSSEMVLECLRASIASYHTPQELLTDNGAQYVTWRGKSRFTHECEKRGIKQIVARPHRPQTLGKIERFWGTLWRELLESTIFTDLGEARTRIGLFIDHYNFQRPHQGLDGLVPADRFFGAAPEVLKTLRERVAGNSLELARNGVPVAPFYLTGNVNGKPMSVHTEGEKMILTRAGVRQEITPLPMVPPPAALPTPVTPVGLVSSPWTGAVEQPPGVSPLDELAHLRAAVAVPPPAPPAPPAPTAEGAGS
jgi:transposase InsO family protein